MQTKKTTNYLMIVDHPEHNQDLTTYTFSQLNSGPNPQNLLSNKLSTNASEGSHFKINSSKYKIHRSIDQYRANQPSPKQAMSQSFVFPTAVASNSKPTLKNGSDDEESQNNYHSLTLKLQKALNKISFSEERLNKSISQGICIWKRSQLQLERKRKELEKKQRENQHKRFKQIQQKPTIDKNSAKIARNSGYQPIHTRFQKIVEQKKRRIEQTQQYKKRQQEQKESLFLEELAQHMKRPNTTRSYGQYFTQMIQWKEKAAEKTKKILQEQKRKEIQSATFKPHLNLKSKRMLADQYRLPIDQRGLVKKKTNLEYSFTPKTTKKI